jgi:hypothetical protein
MDFIIMQVIWRILGFYVYMHGVPRKKRKQSNREREKMFVFDSKLTFPKQEFLVSEKFDD